jgi:hypothetical protein
VIPVNLALSKSSSDTSNLKDHFEIPEGGSTTVYVAFLDSSTVDDFQLRRRVQKRDKTSESFDEWGEWSEWEETLSVRPGGLRLSQTAISMSSEDINPQGFDAAIWEFQVREFDSEEEEEIGWSQSLFAKVLFAPTIALSCSLPDVSTVQVGISSSWQRNDSSISIENILIGNATGPSALPSLLSDPTKTIELTRLVANGSGKFSVFNFKRHPINNEYLTFVYRFSTCDGELEGLRYTPVQVSFSAANTPILSLVPYPEEGRIQITVTDAGDKGKPLTAASILMLDGQGGMDLLPIQIGVPTFHRVPPLDVNITYQAIVTAAGGTRATVTQTTKIDSGGRLWFNWGETLADSMALDASIAWNGSMARKKVYFEPAEGLPKVFHGKGRTNTFTVSGEVLYPRNRDDFESIADATKVIFREPYGKRRTVSIDSVDPSDSAANIQTNVSINITEVQSR